MADTPFLKRGFTMIELLVTLAVLAIILAVAVPGFQEFTRRNQLASATNNLVSSLALARSEAVKRATRVTVASGDWGGGWEVFVDTGTVGDSSDADDSTLRVYQPTSSAAPSVTPDDNFSGYISYLPSGASEGSGGLGSGSFEVCKGGDARRISINSTGRVTTAAGSCS